MNNKGDVTVTMLVIGVFAVCTLALLSFFQSSVEVRNSLVGLNLVEKMNSDIEAHSFAEKVGLKNPPEVKTDVGGAYFSEEKKTITGFWWWKEEKTLFYLKYYIK